LAIISCRSAGGAKLRFGPARGECLQEFVMRLSGSTSGASAAIEGLLVATFCAFATEAAGFETDTWAGSTPASSAAITVDWSEVGPVEGLPDRLGGWVLITYAKSVNCSPPRACYASSQRVYCHVYCALGAIKDIQRTSMDLNGNVLAQTGERSAYIPPSDSVDREVVRILCEEYGLHYLRPPSVPPTSESTPP
jgi:hypothetical protein